MTARTLKDPLNSSGIEPLGNRILIQPDLMDEYSEGGIYIREQDRERHDSSASYGYVVAMGSDAFTHSISVTKRMIDGQLREAERTVVGYSGQWVKPGDRIAFSPYVGLDSVGEDGLKYKTINDEDVLCKVTESVTHTSIEARKPLGIK